MSTSRGMHTSTQMSTSHTQMSTSTSHTQMSTRHTTTMNMDVCSLELWKLPMERHLGRK